MNSPKPPSKNASAGRTGADPAGTAPSDVQTWCVVQTSDAGAPTFGAANLVYHPGAATLDGTLSADCSP